MEKIRILHHLASTGGTLVSRCLAAMTGVGLLSEQHPLRAMRERYDPYVHALWQGWGAEAEFIQAFREQTRILSAAAARSGRVLVIRDWTHADFFGSERLYSMTASALDGHFKQVRAATVRHPIDTWISMTASGFLKFDHAEFLRRFLAFVDMTAFMPVVRYEDICHTPLTAVSELCAALDVPFEMDFLGRLADVVWVTGASGRKADMPGPRPRMPIAEEDFEKLVRNPMMAEICARLGYSVEADPGVVLPFALERGSGRAGDGRGADLKKVG